MPLRCEALRCVVATAGVRPGAGTALRLSALRSFFDWLVGQGELSANPAKRIAAPKIPRHTHRAQKILTSMTSIDCWISISTIRWRCAIGRCWR